MADNTVDAELIDLMSQIRDAVNTANTGAQKLVALRHEWNQVKTTLIQGFNNTAAEETNMAAFAARQVQLARIIKALAGSGDSIKYQELVYAATSLEAALSILTEITELADSTARLLRTDHTENKNPSL